MSCVSSPVAVIIKISWQRKREREREREGEREGEKEWERNGAEKQGQFGDREKRKRKVRDPRGASLRILKKCLYLGLSMLLKRSSTLGEFSKLDLFSKKTVCHHTSRATSRHSIFVIKLLSFSIRQMWPDRWIRRKKIYLWLHLRLHPVKQRNRPECRYDSYEGGQLARNKSPAASGCEFVEESWEKKKQEVNGVLQLLQHEACRKMGPVRIRHSSHVFGWQSSHSLDLAGWQAKMASIEIWIPWRNVHKPHFICWLGRFS